MGRDTLSDEHLIGTAAGVMRSRAVPHLNLPSRSRLQRPAHVEPIEAGTLPRFIEIPTSPTTRNPKSETPVTTPGDAEQSTRRQRQEAIHKESQQVSSSSCAVTDTSKQIPHPQIPKPDAI